MKLSTALSISSAVMRWPGGFSGNTYVFEAGASEGHFTITDFMPGMDSVALEGFSAGALKHALADQTHRDGATTIKLGDHTTITFQDVSQVKGSWFS